MDLEKIKKENQRRKDVWRVFGVTGSAKELVTFDNAPETIDELVAEVERLQRALGEHLSNQTDRNVLLRILHRKII